MKNKGEWYEIHVGREVPLSCGFKKYNMVTEKQPQQRNRVVRNTAKPDRR